MINTVIFSQWARTAKSQFRYYWASRIKIVKEEAVFVPNNDAGASIIYVIFNTGSNIIYILWCMVTLIEHTPQTAHHALFRRLLDPRSTHPSQHPKTFYVLTTHQYR